MSFQIQCEKKDGRDAWQVGYLGDPETFMIIWDDLDKIHAIRMCNYLNGGDGAWPVDGLPW